MSTYLIFDGVNDVVTLPTTMVCNTGTDSWVWEFSIAISSYPASGNRYFIGSNNASTNAGIGLRPASGDGALALVVAGVNVSGFTSPTGYILDDGALHTYRVERDAGADVRFYRDSSLISTVSWVTGTASTLTIGRFGAGSMSTSGIAAFNLEYFEFVSGFSNAEKWDSNLSGGTGSILPTVSGNNQGALVNFPTDNSQWGGAGGAAITGSASVTMPQMAVAVSGSVSVASLSATIALTMPQMSVAASASDSAPLVTASYAFVMPQFAVDASAIASVPTFTASASVTMPQMSAAISGSVVINGNAASLSFSMPQMSVAGVASDTAPIFSASIAATMPQMQVQCQALSVASGVIASINMTMPQMSVAAIASDASPAISASVSLTMPQFSVYAVSGGFSFYESDGAHIETIAASSHLEYTYQSTHIEWRV